MNKSIHKHEKKLLWAIVLSESSHIFCCVLPTLFSLVSLLSTFGLVVAMPGWLQDLHGIMHGWEPVMIGFSVAVVALGWGLHYLAHHMNKLGPHEHTCCDHDHGAPAKASTTHKILIAASVLLIINIGVYFGFHRNADVAHSQHAHETHEVHEEH
jgi:hypothetical protein